MTSALVDADLLLELAVERLLERLAAAHSALRELPAATARAAAEKHLLAVHQYDAHVGSKTFRVDQVAHFRGLEVCHKAAAPP